MGTSGAVPASAKARKPSGKKGKKFLEAKDASIELASSIAGAQEQKSRERSAKHRTAETTPARPDAKRKTQSPSSSRSKLKETKALLKAKHLQHKKEKAQQRKDVDRPVATPRASLDGQCVGTASSKNDTAAPRKRVSFA